MKDSVRSNHWVLTIQCKEDDELPTEKQLIEFFEKQCESYVFQREKGNESEKEHFQCALHLSTRKRKETLLNDVSRAGFKLYQFQFDYMYGSWAENFKYCTKSETRIGDVITNLPYYRGADIDMLCNRENRFPWQKKILEEIIDETVQSVKVADDRSILWIQDPRGNSGKSKLTKYLCYKYSDITSISFGSTSQLASAVIQSGPKKCYIIDIPRTIGRDDDMDAVLGMLENIKNGFVTSSMYGKAQSLYMDPPHILVFTNNDCPIRKMSPDRWKVWVIHNKQLMDENLYNFKRTAGDL